MGVVYSYLYSSSSEVVEEKKKEDEDTETDGASNPNYTILYHQHEKEYLQQLEQAAKKQAEIANRDKLSQEEWDKMIPRYAND